MHYRTIGVREIVTHVAEEICDPYRFVLIQLLDRVANTEDPSERWHVREKALELAQEWSKRSIEVTLKTWWDLQENRTSEDIALRQRYAAYVVNPVVDDEDEEDEDLAADPEPPSVTAGLARRGVQSARIRLNSGRSGHFRERVIYVSKRPAALSRDLVRPRGRGR